MIARNSDHVHTYNSNARHTHNTAIVLRAVPCKVTLLSACKARAASCATLRLHITIPPSAISAIPSVAASLSVVSW